MSTGNVKGGPAARMADAPVQVAVPTARHPQAQPNMPTQADQPNMPTQAERCESMGWTGDSRLESNSPYLTPALSAAARARALSARIRSETSGLGINKHRRRMPVTDHRTMVAPACAEAGVGPSMRPSPPIHGEDAGSAGGFVPTAVARRGHEEDGEGGRWHLNSPRLEESDPIWRRMLAWTLDRPGLSKRASPASRAERDRPRDRQVRGFGAIDTTVLDRLRRQRRRAPAGREDYVVRLPGNVEKGMSVRQSRALVPVAAALPAASATQVWLPHLRYVAACLSRAEARTGFQSFARGRILRQLAAWAREDAPAARESRTPIRAAFDPWSEPAGGTGVLGWLVPRSEMVPACYTPRSGHARRAQRAGTRATLAHPLTLGAAVVFGALIGVVLSLSDGYLPERLSYPWLSSGPSSGIGDEPAAPVQPSGSSQQAGRLVLEPARRTEVQVARAPLAISGPLAFEAQFGDAGEHPSADQSEITTPVAGEWQVLYRLGHEFRRKGDLDAAVQTFALAAKLNPWDPLILYDWGYTLQQKGEDLAAITKYEKVVELDPTHTYAYYNLNYLLQQQAKR